MILYGEMCIHAMGANQQAPQVQVHRGAWGFPPLENFEKFDCLRQRFVHLEGSLIGDRAVKSEGKNMNIYSTFLNLKHILNIFLA